MGTKLVSSSGMNYCRQRDAMMGSSCLMPGGGSSRYVAGVAGITLTMIYQRALESPSEALNRHEKRLHGTQALAEQSD